MFILVVCTLVAASDPGFAQDLPVSVMTFNIRFSNPADGINSWENRKELATSYCTDADLIGMQEVLKSQYDYLNEKLPQYGSVGVGRNDGKQDGEYCPVFFNRERFHLLDEGTFWLSPTPSDTGSVGWDAALPRICTWVKLKEQPSGLEFYFMNTHFDHMGDTARAESARLILDFVQKQTGGMPVILTGDFNCSPEEEPYKVLSESDHGMKDACILFGNPSLCEEGTFNGWGAEKNPQRIDMIFLKGDWKANSYDILKFKNGEMFISDHWPVLATLSFRQPGQEEGQPGILTKNDTTFVQTFTFDSIITRRAVFQFPEKGKRYEKILMYYTLKCDSLTPHDKYPCGEWDYTTYTRVYHRTGKMDSAKFSQANFVVKGKSPKSYLYSLTPTYCYVEEWKRGSGESNASGDRFARFEGADYIEVPGDAFEGVNEEITVSFWLNGDPFHQPMASTIFEGLDANGKRVVNLHVPYDNGVVYWDAGGHGEGLTDNVYKAASPRDYKGRWTHWTVTKNSGTGEQSIYLNGKLFQKGTNLSRTMEGISTFRIGSNGKGDGKFYQGGIDDFAAWGRELDSLEIISLALLKPGDYPPAGLLFAFDFNDNSGFPIVIDISKNGMPGKSFGHPAFIEFSSLPFPGLKPAGEMVLSIDSIPNPVVDIVIYGDSLNPWLPTDTMAVYPGHHYYYNSQGILIDSVAVANATEIKRKTRTWYGKPFEVKEQFEIGRFITPYGKRLDLGVNGFTWVYDVTDYEPLLHGPVDLQAANGQELLDLKFLFIEGVPPRDVISVRNIWPEGSYEYKELADDDVLQAESFKIHAEAMSFKLRARISGHGHYGPYNCCEWDPKTHSFSVDGEKRFDWKVWRDCGMNPVYPQGGTWQFDRAGWCPGTFVDTYDFEITPYVSPGHSVLLDYTIQPYDPDNGEEGGNYEMAMHLFEYSVPNFKLDLELCDILAPSTRHEFRRMNPISLNPVVRVKNNGTDTIYSFIIRYGINSSSQLTYEWNGRLGFMQSTDIVLPKPSWKGLTESSDFSVAIISVNGRLDELESNNNITCQVEAPVILPRKFILHVRTQGFGRAADNAYRIIDSDGKVVAERQVFEDDSVYHDLIRLTPGAYEFSFTDKNEDGMIRHWWLYWEDPEKVGENGELKILTANKKEIMNLGYDFAEKRTLQFFVGEPE